MASSDERRAEGARTGDLDRSAEDRGVVYEPPRLVVIGTLSELTRGSNPTTSDGLGPGSAL
jgi:hypothetical protein